MTRKTVLVVLALLAAGGVAAALALRGEAPELVRELRALPEVARVSYRGPVNPRLTVVHLRDWHFGPRELAEADGVNFDENNARVEQVHRARQVGPVQRRSATGDEARKPVPLRRQYPDRLRSALC